jgi:lipoprotein-releasing system ATP-binding protein
MIQALGLNKFYGDLQVLKNVDLSIAESEIISIVGPSGAGKSTLLQILGSLQNASSGEVSYDGVIIQNLKSNELANFRNQNIGFIFQFHHLLPEFTAIENVCMPAFISGMGRNAAQDRAKELLNQLGLAQRIEHKPSELSGGEQQRVAVARALMNKPQIVFADEPSGNLDTENAEELHQLFLKLREDYGYSFAIVTHNNELAKMADRIVRMKDGGVVENVE